MFRYDFSELYESTHINEHTTRGRSFDHASSLMVELQEETQNRVIQWYGNTPFTLFMPIIDVPEFNELISLSSWSVYPSDVWIPVPYICYVTRFLLYGPSS